jgi:hypothetical protein
MADTGDLKSPVLTDIWVRVPSALPIKMKISNSPRNPYSPLAAKRKAGKHRAKNKKRQNGKNKQQELLAEIEKD